MVFLFLFMLIIALQLWLKPNQWLVIQLIAELFLMMLMFNYHTALVPL